MGNNTRHSLASFIGIYKTHTGRKNLTPYDRLAIAICEQAANDYRKELLVELETGVKTSEAEKIEKFFFSDRGYIFSFGLGDFIIQELRKEVIENNDIKRRNKKRKIIDV